MKIQTLPENVIAHTERNPSTCAGSWQPPTAISWKGSCDIYSGI